MSENTNDPVDSAIRSRPTPIALPASGPGPGIQMQPMPASAADGPEAIPNSSSQNSQSPQLRPAGAETLDLVLHDPQPAPRSPTQNGGRRHLIAGYVAGDKQPHPSTARLSTGSYNSAAPRPSHETQVLTREEVDEKPWKYIGYRGYSQFIASESDFFMLRRFGAVSARVALMLQDRVSELEEELDVLDRRYSRREAVDVNNGTFREDDDSRAEILEKLRAALLQFNEFVLQQAALKAHPQASPQDIRSLGNWHWNHEYRAISPSESSYLTHELDLFSVVPKDKTPLRRLLERSRSFRIHWFWKDKNKPELPVYDQDVITYSSDKRIERFVTLVIVGVGMAMLITPMWVLEFLHGDVEKLATITAFIVVFLGMISYASVARPQEVLGATAAYSAVLMVFLQLGYSGSQAKAP